MQTSNSIIDLVDGFIASHDFEARWATARSAIQSIGGIDFNIGFFDTSHDRQNLIVSTMSSEWRTRYRKRAYHRGDVILRHARTSFEMISEDIGTKTTTLAQSDTELRIDRDLADLGYRGSIAQSFRAPTEHDRLVTTLISDHSISDLGGDEFQQKFKRMSSVIAAFIGTPNRDTPDSYFLDTFPLTLKERDALAYLASGLMNDQIADRLNITEVAVRKRLNAARNKLGAATREQAVAIAVRDRLIDI